MIRPWPKPRLRAATDEVAPACRTSSLRAHEPRIGDPADERHGDVEAREAGPEDRDDREHQHEEREGQHDIDDAHEDRVDEAAEIARDRADEACR